MQDQIYLLDRATLSAADDLIAKFGMLAAQEAALQAERSRGLGNLIHFCRWREIERVVALLSAEDAVFTVH